MCLHTYIYTPAERPTTVALTYPMLSSRCLGSLFAHLLALPHCARHCPALPLALLPYLLSFAVAQANPAPTILSSVQRRAHHCPALLPWRCPTRSLPAPTCGSQPCHLALSCPCSASLAPTIALLLYSCARPRPTQPRVHRDRGQRKRLVL